MPKDGDSIVLCDIGYLGLLNGRVNIPVGISVNWQCWICKCKCGEEGEGSGDCLGVLVFQKLISMAQHISNRFGPSISIKLLWLLC